MLVEGIRPKVGAVVWVVPPPHAHTYITLERLMRGGTPHPQEAVMLRRFGVLVVTLLVIAFAPYRVQHRVYMWHVNRNHH